MTPDKKAKLIVILNTLTLIGGAITIILLIGILGRINRQITATHKDLASAVKQIETDHDQQTKYLRCQLILFGADRTKPVTADQLDACLAGSRIIPNVTSQSVPAVQQNDTNKNTTTNQNPNQSNTSQPKTDTATAPQATVTDPEPQRVLGVPVCVPLTDVCVRK